MNFIGIQRFIKNTTSQHYVFCWKMFGEDDSLEPKQFKILKRFNIFSENVFCFAGFTYLSDFQICKIYKDATIDKIRVWGNPGRNELFLDHQI